MNSLIRLDDDLFKSSHEKIYLNKLSKKGMWARRHQRF
jgi:hypothetical protein